MSSHQANGVGNGYTYQFFSMTMTEAELNYTDQSACECFKLQ